MISLGVSAGGSRSTLGADSGGRMEAGRSIRIVSSNADNFAAIGRDSTRGHFDTKESVSHASVQICEGAL